MYHCSPPRGPRAQPTDPACDACDGAPADGLLSAVPPLQCPGASSASHLCCKLGRRCSAFKIGHLFWDLCVHFASGSHSFHCLLSGTGLQLARPLGCVPSHPPRPSWAPPLCRGWCLVLDWELAAGSLVQSPMVSCPRDAQQLTNRDGDVNGASPAAFLPWGASQHVPTPLATITEAA